MKPVYKLSLAEERDVIDAFARVFYDVNNAHLLHFHNATCLKNPFDLWVYQEIIWKHRPQTIIECGTGAGGSALYMAIVLDYIGKGKIISIDINRDDLRPSHKRIHYINGSSIKKDVVNFVTKNLIPPVMVILDSDHSEDHVKRELDIWSSYVSPGQYLIVEDTNVNGHPVFPTHGPGPKEALIKWLPNHPEFKIDKSCERFLFTYNPEGYLLRV